MEEHPSPQQIVVDLETSVESGLSLLGCFSLLIAAGVGLHGVDTSHFLTEGVQRWVLLGFLLVVPVAWGARMLVDEHYILDLEARKLFFHRRWGGWKSVTPVASFAQFVAFAVQGSYLTTRYDAWWEYTPVLVTRDKRVLRLADGGRNAEGFEQASDTAREMAELTGVPFHPPEAQRILKVTTPGPTLTYSLRKSQWPLTLLIIAVSLFIGIGLALYLK